MMTHTRRVGAALAISLLALTACGPKKATVSDEKDSGSTSQEAKEEKKSENPKFGQSAAWDDGVKVTVKNEGAIDPSTGLKWDQPGTPTSFEVTIENGSQKNIKPSSFYFVAQSGGKEADKIYSSKAGYELEPSTVLLPGKSVTFKIGFGIEDPNDITLEVKTFDFDKDSIIFTN